MSVAGSDRGQQPSERRHLTVMFCDVVGSTRLSRDRDVEAYFSLLRAYYDACRPVVERHGGFVAQHHGDGIYVWFGYPEPREDDGVRAVRAGLDLLVVLRRLSARLEAEVGEPLSVRIAAHAGEVFMTAVDNEPGVLAFGHTPNLAAKLQQAAEPGTMVVSADLRRLIEDRFDVEARPGAVLPDGTVVPAYKVLSERQRAGRVGRAWRTPLIGRAGEREHLRQAWAATRAGAGRTLVVLGDRGVGKTRLASAVVEAAESAEANVLDCVCHELDTTTVLRPLRTLLAQAAGIDPADPPAVCAARLQDHLIDRLGMDRAVAILCGTVLGLPSDAIGPAPELDPSKLALLTAQCLVDWVTRLAAEKPTVVLVDDVADADPSSLAVLALLSAARPPGLLLIFTARSDVALPPFLEGDQVEALRLEPLGEDASESVIDAVSAASPLELHVRQQILTQGDGIPLYIEELTRAAQESVGPTTVPITLTGRLQARLAVPGVDRTVVGALAAAGHDVDEAVLAGVLGVETDEVRDRVAGAMARDLVVDVGAAGSSYRFRHGLIRDAAYGLLLQDQRTEMHSRLADATADRHAEGRPVDWNVVGRHLRLARRPLDAYEALLAAAVEARAAGAMPEALQSYREALDIVDEIADPGVRDLLEIRCRLQRGVTAVSARGFGADEAVEDFDRCAQLCRQLGPRPEHLSAMTGVFAFYLLQGELAGARRIAEDLRSWVESTHGEYGSENALAFGVLSFFEGDYTAAVGSLRVAVAQFRSLPPDGRTEQNWLLPFDPLVTALSHLASVLWIMGQPREGQEAGDRAVARAATLPFPTGPFSMAYAKSYLAWTNAIGGNYETAARLAVDVRDIGQRHGFAFWESTGEIHLALAEHWSRGRPDASETVALHASIWGFLRSRVFLPYVLTAAAEATAVTDQAARAAGYAEAGRLVDETGVRFYESERLRLLARTVASPADARPILHEAVRLAHRQGALLFELRAAVDLARLDDVDVGSRLATIVDRFPSGAGYRELNEARALLARAPTPT